MSNHPEEEEGFEGVCRFCGTDCGYLKEASNKIIKIAEAMREIQAMTSRQSLPLTAAIHQIATEALK